MQMIRFCFVRYSFFVLVKILIPTVIPIIGTAFLVFGLYISVVGNMLKQHVRCLPYFEIKHNW